MFYSPQIIIQVSWNNCWGLFELDVIAKNQHNSLSLSVSVSLSLSLSHSISMKRDLNRNKKVWKLFPGWLKNFLPPHLSFDLFFLAPTKWVFSAQGRISWWLFKRLRFKRNAFVKKNYFRAWTFFSQLVFRRKFQPFDFRTCLDGSGLCGSI